MLEAYRAAAAEREALGIPPLPLTAKQTEELVELLKNPPKGEEKFLVELLSHLFLVLLQKKQLSAR